MKTRHTLIIPIIVVSLAACTPLEEAEDTPKVTATSAQSEQSQVVDESEPVTTAPPATSKATACQLAPADVLELGAAFRNPQFASATLSDWYYTTVPEKDRSSIGEPKWPGVIAAAKVNGQADTIALWGIGGLNDAGQMEGLIAPLNVTAWQVSEFGQDFGKPGDGSSPFDKARDKVVFSKAAGQAEKCAIQGKAS